MACTQSSGSGVWVAGDTIGSAVDPRSPLTATPMAFPGQRDYSTARLTRHALERFVERFGVEAEEAEPALRNALARTRRLGRNPANGAVAVLTLHREKILVAILNGSNCLTVLTWAQFEPRMPEFGRSHLPRKRGRMLRRLIEPDQPSEP
jgi:hypothetical protein